MSEIKVQLLGIILTISIFSAVLATMTVAFKKISEGVADQANSAITETVSIE